MGKMIEHKGKGSQSELLPSHNALSQLTRAPGAKMNINDYSKKGAPITQNGPSLVDPEKP